MVSIKQGSGYERAFDKTQISPLLVFQQLIAERLIALHFCDNCADLDPKFSASLKATAAIDQAIAITLKRAHQYWNTLS
jgi:hypothetical protein